MVDYTMPSLGADMDDGTILEWHIAPGDTVHKGDIVAVVDTPKAAIEVEIFFDGVVEELLVEPGTKVAVGTPIARLRTVGEETTSGTTLPSAASEPPPAPAEPLRPIEVLGAPVASSRLRITPSARRLAREHGLDPATLVGTGPHGAITRADVVRAEHAKKGPGRSDVAVRRGRVRQAVAAAMTRSNRDIPHYYLSHTVSMGRALSWLRAANQTRSVDKRLLSGVLLLKATALALHEVPELNGWWADDKLEPSADVHLGAATSLRGGGVVVPAIHHADRLTLDELMAAFVDVVARTRAGSLRQGEITDATVTVTSLGERGPEEVFGVIFPPQVALVGFGSILERPWVVGGEVVPQPVVTATLAADRRASDGHRGGLLLSAIDRLLQQPEAL